MKKISFSDLSDIEKDMLKKARICRENAYAPYSNFKVGASLLSNTGNIYSGCNVESADFTLTTHAEMNSIDTMVACGEQKIKKILIVMKSDLEYSMPCGLCRQKILEFADGNIEILGVNLDENNEIKGIFQTTIMEIYPYSFGHEYLKKGEGKNIPG